MSRKKRTSRALEKAELRSAGLKAINPTLDFGDAYNLNNLTQDLTQVIEQLRAKINAYNTALSMIDSSKTEIDDLEKTLNTLSEKMLMGVALKYGKDSLEYQMAGGVRTSDRVRKTRVNRLKANTEELTSEAKSA